MDDLVVPFDLAGLKINRHQAIAIQPIAGAMTAVEVGRRRLYRQIGKAGFRIGSDLSPYAGVAGVFRRTIEPGFIAGLAFLRDGVEFPKLLAAAHIIST